MSAKEMDDSESVIPESELHEVDFPLHIDEEQREIEIHAPSEAQEISDPLDTSPAKESKQPSAATPNQVEPAKRVTNCRKPKQVVRAKKRRNRHDMRLKAPMGQLEKRLRVGPPRETPEEEVNRAEVQDELLSPQLAPFIPTLLPPSRLQLDIPADGYTCPDCGDRFLLECSLSTHLNRRSVQITYSCPFCAGCPLLFYNRCALLAHLRNHVGKRPSLQSSFLDVKPLPPEMLDLAPPPPTELDDRGRLVSTAGSILGFPHLRKMKPWQCTECQQEFDTESNYTDHFDGGIAARQVAPTAKALRRCDLCDAFLPSVCAAKAHIRLHTRKEPFVCPDCGRCFVTWTNLNLHLQLACFHSHRRFQYICPLCSSAFYNLDLVSRHVLVAHTRVLYKCVQCPIAFANRSIANTHWKETHSSEASQSGGSESNAERENGEKNETVLVNESEKFPINNSGLEKSSTSNSGLEKSSTNNSSLEKSHTNSKSTSSSEDTEQVDAASSKGDVAPQLKQMRKCPFCDNVFFEALKCFRHVTEHVTLQTVVQGVYCCPECDSNFSTRDRFGGHYHQCTGVKSKSGAKSNPSPLKVDGNSSMTNGTTEHKAAEEGLAAPKLKCERCSRMFHTRRGMTLHEGHCRGPAEAPVSCRTCKVIVGSAKSLARHGQKHLESGMKVCLFCSNLEVGSEKFEEHIQNHIKKIKVPYICFICKYEMKDDEDKERHLRGEHNMNGFSCSDCSFTYPSCFRLRRHREIMHDSEVPGRPYICWICQERDFGKRISLQHHIVTTHKIPQNEIDFSLMPTHRMKRPLQFPKSPGPSHATLSEVKAEAALASPSTTKLHKCAKCGYSCTDSEDFSIHISTHKLDPNAPQCKYCGLCFVVVPSLKRHLFLQHHIRMDNSADESEDADSAPLSPSNGMKTELAEEIDEPSSPPGKNEPLEPNQCTVCRRKFPSEFELTKHFRCHGMAFLLMKKKTLNQQTKDQPANSDENNEAVTLEGVEENVEEEQH